MSSCERAFRFSGRLRARTRTLGVGADATTRRGSVSWALADMVIPWGVQRCAEVCNGAQWQVGAGVELGVELGGEPAVELGRGGWLVAVVPPEL